MIIVTFFTYLTQSISYATTSGSSATVEAKENMEKAPEVGELNVEKNPMIQPKDRVSIGRTERADQIKNTDADLKEGSKYRGSSMDIVALTLNVIVVAIAGIFCLPILIGAVIISVIATINTNQKYIEAYEKGESARKKDTKIPIIFLTVKALKQDILEGFKIGADDYITKPFSMEELLFRIEAILRRVSLQKLQMGVTEYKFGKFVFDCQKQVLVCENEKTKLTTKESEMLRALLQSGNQILERNSALKTIWGEVTYFNARSMDVYITKLRKILQKDPEVSIVNIHGKGYKIVYPSQE